MYVITRSISYKKDPLYFEGYKIYRDDKELQRRKWMTILVNTKLDVDVQRINGMFEKNKNKKYG